MDFNRLILLCWAIFIIYWVVSAQSVKPTKEVGVTIGNMWWNISGRIVLILLLLAGIGNTLPVPFLSFRLLPRNDVLSVISLTLVTVGLGIAISARKILADNWSANVDVKKKHELITRGVYSYMRHPIYTGVICMVLGTFFSNGAVSTVVLLLICVSFLLYKLQQEEALLTKHFPKEYSAYQKRVKALIPYLW